MHMVVDETGHDHAAFEINDAGGGAGQQAHRRTGAHGEILAARDRETFRPRLCRILGIDRGVDEYLLGESAGRSARGRRTDRAKQQYKKRRRRETGSTREVAVNRLAHPAPRGALTPSMASRLVLAARWRRVSSAW